MTFEWVLAFVALGGVVGFIAGLLGVGGGGVLVPALTSMLVYQGIPEHQVLHVALGTSMACIIVTSFSSARAHHKLQAVNWSIAWGIGAGCIFGTFVATFFAAQTKATYLALFFALFMFYTAYKILFKANQISVTKKDSKTTTAIKSICIGGISALVSIGGGSLLVPYLNRQGMKLSEAVGTSAAIGLPIAVTGSAGYLLNGVGQTMEVANTYGYIYLPAVGVISLASVISAPIGAKISHRLQVKVLKKLFALLILGVKMAWAVM